MDGIFDRSEALLGDAAFSRLQKARVAIFGLGGVGSWCAEALARTGVGSFTLVDFDVVAPSNVNRQAMAFPASVGKPKADELARRLLSISPRARVESVPERFEAANPARFDFSSFDCVVDAIDSLDDKAELILAASSCASTCLFSSMGAAFRTDPLKVATAEFWKVAGDGLARALRGRFRKSGRFPARKFQCVYSTERPLKPQRDGVKGSLMQVTAAFGLALASRVVRHLAPSAAGNGGEECKM